MYRTTIGHCSRGGNGVHGGQRSLAHLITVISSPGVFVSVRPRWRPRRL